MASPATDGADDFGADDATEIFLGSIVISSPQQTGSGTDVRQHDLPTQATADSCVG